MLIRYFVTNWRTFKERVEFNLVASREKQHVERLPLIKKFPVKLLPVAAIFGANASGKSNFVESLAFAQKFILQGCAPGDSIPTHPFLLDDQGIDAPSTFEFTILVDDQVYEYAFSVTRDRVVSESLSTTNSSTTKVLFERQRGDIVVREPMETVNQGLPFLDFVAQGTRENQLFLTEAISRNVHFLNPVWNWFKHSLRIFTPRTQPTFKLADTENNELLLPEAFNEMLRRLDTGIHHLELRRIHLEESFFRGITLSEGQSTLVSNGYGGERILVTKRHGELEAYRILAARKTPDGRIVHFSLEDESDGTNRLIDFIPGLNDLKQPNSRYVYVIDELDRSLHPKLTRFIVGDYLNFCTPESRSQLIFTTHDTELMDQSLLRRDELWMTDLTENGWTNMYACSDFKDIRKDKFLKKHYLRGLLGGVPVVPIAY